MTFYTKLFVLALAMFLTMFALIEVARGQGFPGGPAGGAASLLILTPTDVVQVIDSAWDFGVPSLGSSGSPCVVVDSSGTFSTTTCSAAGSSLSTTSPWTVSQLAYVVSNSSVSSVATTTLSGTANQLSISNSPVVIGSSGAVLSLPNHVIFPGNFQATNATTTNATTTSLYITSLTSALLLIDGNSQATEYAGIDCTNQFVRDVSAAGAGTCASVVSADITNDTIVNDDINSAAGIAYSKLTLTGALLEADLKAVDAAGDEEILTYESTGGDFEWHTGAELCVAITGSAELCDGDDAEGAGGGSFPFSADTNFGQLVYSTSTPTLWFKSGLFASSTSQFDNSTTTLATIGTAWLTSLFIGADTIAEYISDTAGAFFTGNTETGITVTYQDADNTVDVVCATSDTDTFGCLTSTDWDTFNGKENVLTAGDGLTRTANDIDFDGGASPGGSLGGTWASPTIDDLFVLLAGDSSSGDYTWTGAHDFSGASLEIPNGTAPTTDATGEIAWDTTSGNLKIATSTTGSVVIGSATSTLYAFSVASTSPDFASGGGFNIPSHFLAQAATAIICSVEAGTSQVINLSNAAGTSDTNAVTCTTTEALYALTANNTYAALAQPRLEFGTKTGTPDYLHIRIVGYRTSD